MCYRSVLDVGVHPRGEAGEIARLHVNPTGSAHLRDQSLTAKETGEDSSRHADPNADRRFVANQMAGIDDIFVGDLAGENAAIGREPDAPGAVHFEPEQALTPDKTGDSRPFEAQLNTRLTREECPRLQK